MMKMMGKDVRTCTIVDPQVPYLEEYKHAPHNNIYWTSNIAQMSVYHM